MVMITVKIISNLLTTRNQLTKSVIIEGVDLNNQLWVHSPYESGSSYTKTTYISGEARGRFERLNPSDAIIVNICLKSLLAHSAAVKDDCPLESLCPDFEAKIRVLRKSAELPLRGGPDQPGRDGVFSYKAAS
ncbi:hypothetical protein ACHWQZ_G011831 [Mnemiopsis leidyi]